MFTPSGLRCSVVRSFGVPAGVLGVLDVKVWKLDDKNRYFLTVNDSTKCCVTPEYLQCFGYERYFEENCLFTLKDLEKYDIDNVVKKAASLEKHANYRARMKRYYSDLEAGQIDWFCRFWSVNQNVAAA